MRLVAWMRRVLSGLQRPHRPAPAAARRRETPPDRDARYPAGERGSSSWRDIRKFVVARDGACVECGATERLTVDHIRPLSAGGSNAPANLRTLCKACHKARHRG